MTPDIVQEEERERAKARDADHEQLSPFSVSSFRTMCITNQSVVIDAIVFLIGRGRTLESHCIYRNFLTNSTAKGATRSSSISLLFSH